MEIQLANNLRTLRLKNKLTQEQMADLLDIDIKRYQAWEYGRNEPSIKNLLTILKLFTGATLEELLLTKLNTPCTTNI